MLFRVGFKRLFTGCFTLTAAAGGTLVYTNPQSAVSQYLNLSCGGAYRFCNTLWHGLAISVSYYWKLHLLMNDKASEEYCDTLHQCHVNAANRILKGCLENGGLYIKLGQGLCCMNHILPKEYAQILKTLHNKAVQPRNHNVDQVFMEDFGKLPEEMFENFDRTRIASASIADVHKAVTKNKDIVVVKLQHAELRGRFNGDIWLLEGILKIISIMHPSFNFSWVLQELKETLAQELDFENEGRNAERCQRELENLDFAYVPKIYWDMTSKRVLTMEYIEGIHIDEKEKLIRNGFCLKDIGRRFVRVFANQIFVTGFVHADPHPGNILIRRTGKSYRRTQLVILDHGLYEVMQEEQRKALCGFYSAILIRDEQLMREYSAKLGVHNWMIFAEMILQRPVRGPNLRLLSKAHHMSNEDREYMQEQAADRFNQVMEVLQQIPKPMLLFLRNLNTVRAILYDHGQVVNRFRLMIKPAVSGLKAPFFVSLKLRLRALFLSYVDTLMDKVWDFYLNFFAPTETANFIHKLKEKSENEANLALAH